MMEVPVPPMIPGDPRCLTDLANTFRSVATNARQSAAQLTNAKGAVQWESDAADAFHDKLKGLPDDLSRVDASFGRAASVLLTYAQQLGQLQDQYRRVLPRFESVLQELNANLARAQAAAQAGQDTSYYDRHVQDLDHELNRLYATLFNLHHDAVNHATGLKDSLEQAANIGILNDWGNSLQRYGGDVAGVGARL